MKNSILCVLGVLVSVQAFAIDNASSVFKAVQCKAVQARNMSPSGNSVANIYISGSRANPMSPFVLSYRQELWAETANGPTHQVFDYPNLTCATMWYRSGSTTYGGPHFELDCKGKSSEGDAFVLFNVDPRVNPRTGISEGNVTMAGFFSLQCTYERF